jgi:cation transporter-like permease
LTIRHARWPVTVAIAGDVGSSHGADIFSTVNAGGKITKLRNLSDNCAGLQN